MFVSSLWKYQPLRQKQLLHDHLKSAPIVDMTNARMACKAQSGRKVCDGGGGGRGGGGGTGIYEI
jgi:uncharacterized membrane protein